MLPVATAHVGCTVVNVGATGGVGCAFTVTGVCAVQVLSAVLRTVMVCGPAASVYPPAGYDAYAPPSTLTSSPVVDEVIVTVPVATAHVGCTTLTAGAVGGVG